LTPLETGKGFVHTTYFFEDEAPHTLTNITISKVKKSGK